jgi:hypothetical protein
LVVKCEKTNACHPTSDHCHHLLKRHGWSIGDVAFRDLDTGRTTWLVTGSRGEHVISAKGRTQVEAWENACRLARINAFVEAAATSE